MSRLFAVLAYTAVSIFREISLADKHRDVIKEFVEKRLS